jgi:hypothetical protein
MATRQTRLITKNSNIVNRPLPTSLLQGEAIVNTADGIMFFSGITTSTTNWTPAGTGATEQTFFEVGSNLYDLRLRNRITKYEGQTGAGLVGKFLSGTTNGFVLADISNISGIDTYVTGGSLTTSASTSSNLQTTQLSYNITPAGGPYSISTQNTFTTGGTYDNSQKQITFLRNDGKTGYTVDLSTIDVNDTYVTGGTNTAATTSSPNASIGLLYNQDIAPGTYSLPYTNVFTTGFTYNSVNNSFTITDNSGNAYSDSITTVSGLSFSNLTQGRVVYVGVGGLLKDKAAFTYNEGTDTLGVKDIQASGDVVVQGNLTVFGSSISAFTSNLYVEDNNIILNYNPTGSSTSFSVNAGITIQDGNGITGDSVNFDIIKMWDLTGITPTQVLDLNEYTGSTGYTNRGWITQLNDIVIRSTDITDSPTDPQSPGAVTGVRVLAEFDVLSGGEY